jgi:hypothetical protein
VSEAPLFFVEGLKSGVHSASRVVALGVITGATAFACGASIDFTPWLHRGPLSSSTPSKVFLEISCVAFAAQVAGPIVLALSATLWGLRRFRRSGRVEFYEEKILTTHGFGWDTIGWNDLTGFRDDSSDLIELVLKNGKRAFVPTLDENSRVAVLAILERKGLARLEP